MGPRKGRERKGELPDMTIYPPAELGYELPPPEECEEERPPPIYLGDIPGNRLHCRFRLWVVDWCIVEFAVVQEARIEGAWHRIAKIDTCWGMVHRHLYERVTGEDKIDHRELAKIPPEGGPHLITRWYDKALTLMDNEWEENLRRWHRD